MTKIKIRLGLLHRLSLQEYLAHEVCKHILRIEAKLFGRTDCPTPFGALQGKMYARKISFKLDPTPT